LGARVTVVARPTPSPVDRALIGENTENPLRQGKEIITLDLKAANGAIAALDLIADADALWQLGDIGRNSLRLSRA